MEHSTAITTRADYRHHGQRDRYTLPFYLFANLLITADKGKGIEIARAMAIRGSSRGKGQLPHGKISYIYRSSQPWQLPPSVGRWGLCLQQGTPFFASTFQKSVIFNKLAKMTVENLCKMPKFCNQLPLIARSKTATYANFHEIATRNEPFSSEPLHCISG